MTAARVNLKTNPSFTGGTSSYAALNAATLGTTNIAYYGDQALLVTKAADNNSGVQGLDAISVVATKTYALSAYVRIPQTVPETEAASLQLQVSWRNAAGTVIGTNTSGVLDITDDSIWYRLSGVWVAPSLATTAIMQVTQPIGGTAGKPFITDAWLFEQANYVGGYFNQLTPTEQNRLVNRALSTAAPTILNGIQLDSDIIINDLVLNTIDEDGTVWICTSIDNWWGQTAPDSPDIPRGTEDGSYDVSGRYTARTITLNGSFYPPSTDALGKARDRLVEAVNLVRQGGWFRTNESPTKAAFVRLAGAPQIQTVNARGRTDFSVSLKAGDPNKYEWDDSDPDGYTHVSLGAATGIGVATNIGTATVTGLFTLTGPLGGGSTIYNAATRETITLIQSLRGAGSVGTVTSAGVTNGVATMQTSANHHLISGDEIVIVGVGSPYDTVNTTAIVISASQVFPYSFSYAIVSDDLATSTVNGTVQLADNDTLTIDTYQKSVTFNGDNLGQRSKLDTLTDWIKLGPGDNTIEFNDDIDHLSVTQKSIVSNVATLTTSDTHYLIPGESIVVNLSTVVALAKKQLTSNVVTLTTAVPHAFSVGDLINVSSTEQSVVTFKSITAGTATLTTAATNGVSVSDSILVALPGSAVPATKSLTSNVATVATTVAHGFSAGDSVTIAFTAVANIVNKLLAANQATLTTAAAHNFQINDSITVALPTTTTITNKAKSGAQAIITTGSAHGFSIGDVVVMALPTTATPTNSRSMAGSAGNYLATINTSAAHNFSVGDHVTVAVGYASTYTTTSRTATTTSATLTLSGTHGFAIGEKITVSGVTGSQYNGTFYITGVTGTTVTYAIVGGTAQGATADTGGSVVNNTIAAGYNGDHIIETIPSSTSFTFEVWAQDVATSSTTPGSGATVTDTTNVGFNGTKTLTSASSSSFAYNY